jgi:cell wall-associated NlpC family hydrolase
VGFPVLLIGVAASFPQAAGANNPPALAMGATGHWVKVLQQDLTDVGYGLPVTGTYGKDTERQVNAYKRAQGLKPNGKVSAKMWTALDSSVNSVEHRRFKRARLNHKGLVVAPHTAPIVVKRIISAANRIAFKPYIYGGGHASFHDKGYDCSGSVSYALHGGKLLWFPEDSSELESYGGKGLGKWVTIYANAGHAYMKIAGIWFDTAAQQWGSYGHGDRWSTKNVSHTAGYVVRHPRSF